MIGAAGMWPPLPGDVWTDRAGRTWFCHAAVAAFSLTAAIAKDADIPGDRLAMIPATGPLPDLTRLRSPERWLRRHEPVRLLFRLGAPPNPYDDGLGQAVEVVTGRSIEPGDRICVAFTSDVRVEAVATDPDGIDLHYAAGGLDVSYRTPPAGAVVRQVPTAPASPTESAERAGTAE